MFEFVQRGTSVEPMTLEIAEVNDLYLGGVSDARLSGWVCRNGGFPHIFTRLTEFPNTPGCNSPPNHGRTGLHTKFSSLLLDFNQRCNVLTSFSRTLQYQISQKPVRRFSSFYMWKDGQTDHGEGNRHVLATFNCEQT
jgi:hypothetical protein